MFKRIWRRFILSPIWSKVCTFKVMSNWKQLQVLHNCGPKFWKNSNFCALLPRRPVCLNGQDVKFLGQRHIFAVTSTFQLGPPAWAIQKLRGQIFLWIFDLSSPFMDSFYFNNICCKMDIRIIPLNCPRGLWMPPLYRYIDGHSCPTYR